MTTPSAEGFTEGAYAHLPTLDQLLTQTHEAVGDAVEARLNEGGSDA